MLHKSMAKNVENRSGQTKAGPRWPLRQGNYEMWFIVGFIQL